MLSENLSARALDERVTCAGAGRLSSDRLVSTRPALHTSHCDVVGPEASAGSLFLAPFFFDRRLPPPRYSRE